MPVLNASDAFLDKERMLPQHQTALALIQNIVEDPQLTQFSWLDLCCGRGQIITHLESIINENGRSKIDYYAYDVKSEFASIAEKTAAALGFKSIRVEIGDIGNFPRIYTDDSRFDFITLTNTVHEVNVHILAKLYIDSIIRLGDGGCLFIYDMERLPTLELGAITWTAVEMHRIISELIRNLGITEYLPTVSRLPHRAIYCWSIQLKRDYFRINREQLVAQSEVAIKSTQEIINRILREKHQTCKEILDSLTRYGSDSKQEENELQSTLYDFWALSRALEVVG